MLYFAESRNELKIGYAAEVDKRMRQHNSYGFQLIAAMPGSYEDEQRLLEYFREFLVRGNEFFRKNDKIYNYLTILMDKGFAHPDAQLASQLPELPYSTWAPDQIVQTAVEHNGQTTIFPLLPAKNRVELISKQLQNSSKTDEWYTPEDIIELAKKAFGGQIDTDPATSFAVNLKFIRAKIFYTKHTNGLDLTRPWSGNVWLNPPYGRGEGSAGDFIARLTDEVAKGSIDQAITCLNLASMSSRWFYTTIPKHAKVHCIINGRPNFYPPEGKTDLGSPTKGTVLTYFGDGADRFCDVFESIGQLLKPRSV